MAKEIQNLWREVRELSLGTKIDRLDSPPSPVKFLRDYVSQSKPCLISNAISHWPALKLWSDPAYLARALSNDLVSLHLTPNGCADAVNPVGTGDRDLCFASAHVEKVPFPEALRVVQSSSKGQKVGYLQQQNDCFRTEYSTVALDCDGDIAWATEALGCSPEAVNLWIGTDHSVTSFHKDHYENLYAVVSGEKHFLLLPPTDVHRLYVQQYPTANYSYHRDTEAFKLELEEPMRHVPWCSVDPYPSLEKEASERLKYPLFFNGPKPFHCTVKAGEILYLPSMWFHHVSQTPGDGGYTIAVNYWYDMQFDIKYAYLNFLQSLSYKSSSLNPILSWREEEISDDAERISGKNSGTGSMVNSFSGVPKQNFETSKLQEDPIPKNPEPPLSNAISDNRTPCCFTSDIRGLLDCLSPPGTEDPYSSLDQTSADTCDRCWGYEM